MNGFKKNYSQLLSFSILIFIFIILPTIVLAECTCDEEHEDRNKAKALRYKIAALVSILVASAIGVCIPFLGKIIPSLSPEKDIFFIIKAFAAGVILSTGFIHVLPDAFENLTSPRLKEHPWRDFPFTGFVAMCTAMGALMVDAYATSYFQKSYLKRGQSEDDVDVKMDGGHHGHEGQAHTHVTHGHAHGADSSKSSELLRHRVISQSMVGLRLWVELVLEVDLPRNIEAPPDLQKVEMKILTS
ncbi:hypothetical protein RIF29_27297 [Crotalaria pallida]|uniref:Zinc transporter n=1 Tax=Crotalaria pallida TaxID=3830 RepID=A0AAN9I0W8_CROPI